MLFGTVAKIVRLKKTKEGKAFFTNYGERTPIEKEQTTIGYYEVIGVEGVGFFPAPFLEEDNLLGKKLREYFSQTAVKDIYPFVAWPLEGEEYIEEKFFDIVEKYR